MKKILLALTLTILLSNQVMAEASEAELNEKLSSIGFGKIFSREPKEQITSMFEKYQKHANNHNLTKVRSYYSDKYANADGFDVDTYFSLIKQTWEMYPDMKYTTTIKSIDVNGDYATVQTGETSWGTAKEPSEYLQDNGSLESCSEVIYFLEKIGNNWKIVSDTAVSEKTYLKYGDAKDIAMDIVSPKIAVAGSDYSVMLEAEMPSNMMILGSITNEKITYPTEKPKEVFRKLKEDGILERIVQANTEGYNENAVISLGVTKAEISEDQDIRLNVSGVAFLMSRVNVVQKKKFDLGAMNGQESKL